MSATISNPYTYERLAREDLNPRQARIVVLMAEHDDAPFHEQDPPMTRPMRGKPKRIVGWSPKELADWFDDDGWTLGATAYHVRTLVAEGWLKLAGERRVRGAVEHFYVLDVKRLNRA